MHTHLRRTFKIYKLMHWNLNFFFFKVLFFLYTHRICFFHLSLKAASIIHTKYFHRYNGFSDKMHHTKELYYCVIYISLIYHPNNISTGKRIHAFNRDNIDLTLLWNQSPIHVSENKVSCRITKMRSPMHWHVAAFDFIVS